MRFIIRDVLWLIVVVALALGWRMQLHDMLDTNASLSAERDAYRALYNRLDRGRDGLEVEHRRNSNDLRLLVDSIHDLGIDIGHLVSTSRIAKNTGNTHHVRVVVEPVPPRSFNTAPGMDVSF